MILPLLRRLTRLFTRRPDLRAPHRIPSGMLAKSFETFPDLAAYCRPRVGSESRRHLIYGTGSAFRHLLEYLSSGGHVRLLAVGPPDTGRPGELRRIRWVIAHRGDDQPGRDAVLLFADPTAEWAA